MVAGEGDGNERDPPDTSLLLLLLCVDCMKLNVYGSLSCVSFNETERGTAEKKCGKTHHTMNWASERARARWYRSTHITHNRNEMRACSKSNMIWYCVGFTFESLKCVDISFFLHVFFFSLFFLISISLYMNFFSQNFAMLFFRLNAACVFCVCIFRFALSLSCVLYQSNRIRGYCCVSKNIDIFVVLELRCFRLYIYIYSVVDAQIRIDWIHTHTHTAIVTDWEKTMARYKWWKKKAQSFNWNLQYICTRWQPDQATNTRNLNTLSLAAAARDEKRGTNQKSLVHSNKCRSKARADRIFTHVRTHLIIYVNFNSKSIFLNMPWHGNCGIDKSRTGNNTEWALTCSYITKYFFLFVRLSFHFFSIVVVVEKKNRNASTKRKLKKSATERHRVGERRTSHQLGEREREYAHLTYDNDDIWKQRRKKKKSFTQNLVCSYLIPPAKHIRSYHMQSSNNGTAVTAAIIVAWKMLGC